MSPALPRLLPLAELGIAALIVLALGAAPAQALPVTRFAAPGGPQGITTGPDGNLWYTQQTGGVARMTPTGVVTEFVAGITAQSGPTTIVNGPDGNLWFTEHEGNAIGRITPAGTVTELKLGGYRYDGPNQIAVGPDGNLWVTRMSSILRITPSGAITEFSAGITAGPRADTADPYGIVTGPDGNLWFGESDGDRIGRITPAGVVSEFALGATGESIGPAGIAVGTDDNLWIAEYYPSAIARVTAAGVATRFTKGITVHSGPGALVAGPDGNLWFTEENGTLGRITTAGVVTEFDIGIRDYPELTVGPDSNLWLTDYEDNAIVRVQLTASPDGDPPHGSTKEPSDGIPGKPGAQPGAPQASVRAGAVSVSAKGIARVKLQCAQACSGRLTLTRGGHRLGTRKFTSKSGKFVVQVKLSAAARRQLKYRKRLQAIATLVTDGQPAKRAVELRR